MIHNSIQGGFMTLLGVLIVAAIGLAVSVSLLTLGLGATRTSFAIEQAYQANAIALGCSEEVLQKIYDSMVPTVPPTTLTPFSGSGNITFGNYTCSYTSYYNDSDGTMKITTTGTVGTIKRRVQINLSSASPITVSSWQEVADFN